MDIVRSPKVRFIIKIVVSLALILFILQNISLRQLLHEIATADVRLILFAYAFTSCTLWLRAYRWKKLVRSLNIPITNAHAFSYTMIGFAFGSITPGKVGELIKAKYLSDSYKAKYLKSILSVLMDKGFDLIALLLVALVSISFTRELSQLDKLSHLALILVGVITAGILAGFVFFTKLKKIFRCIVPKKYKSGFDKYVNDKVIYLEMLGISVVVWVILGIQAFVVARSLGLPVNSLFTMLGLISLLALFSAIPISLGGIGVREITAVYFLTPLNITIEASVAFSLLFSFIGAWTIAIGGAIVHLMYKGSATNKH